MRIATILVSFLVFLLNSGLCFGEVIKADSKITAVTVYPDSAMVSRVASFKLGPGAYKIVFPDIIPDVDENSLKVTATGGPDIKILGVQLKKEFLQEIAAERLKQIQEKIVALEDERNTLDDNKAILSEEKQFLDSLRFFSKDQLPKDLVTKTPSAKDLEEIFKFLDVKLKENYSKIQETELNIRGLKKKIEALKSELSQVSGSTKKSKTSVVVDLRTIKSSNFDLNVSFLVRGASWQPVYDARANFEKSEVELVSHAIVRQSSGEDWNGIDISLSTAKPSVGGNMPYVAPWFLSVYQRTDRVGFLTRSKTAAPSVQYEAFNQAIGGVSGEVEYATPEEKGIAVVYRIPNKATVKSDGSEHKLPVSSQILQAKFEYSTYPRLNPSAFLGSRVTNAKELQLLAGKVSIFLDGDYVGQSSIGNIGPGEEFDLYLGADENVKVKRELIEKKVDDVLIAGIPSPTRKTTFKYKATLENYKNKNIKLIFFEAMPVFQDEKIRVKILNTSLEPKEKDWKDRKGIWRFEMELAPKEKKEIFYSFSVEHPRDLGVEGL